MEEKKFLPIGSIVYVPSTVRKMMIVARGAFVKQENENVYFDYAACTYPEGIIKDELFYFHQEDIQEIVAEGYSDEEEERMRKNLETMIPKMKKRMHVE